MSQKRIACHKCRHVWSFEPPLGRRDECPKCHADAKVCLNCSFYDPGSYRECREEQAGWVKDKTTGNFCDYFDAKAEAGAGGGEADKARSKLDQLFRGAKPTESAEKPGASLADQLKKFLDAKK